MAEDLKRSESICVVTVNLGLARGSRYIPYLGLVSVGGDI